MDRPRSPERIRARARMFAPALAFAVATVGPAPAQEMATAVAPDTVAVGDPIRIAVRVQVPQGYRVVFPDSLPVTGDVENAARPRMREDTLAAGGRRLTALYQVSAWRPGAAELPVVTVRLVGPEGGVRELTDSLPGVTVASVLPGDTAGIEPKPEKGVLGPSWLLWPWILLIAALVAVGVGIWAWRRHRRGYVSIPLVSPPPPKQRVLDALDRALALRLIESGEYKAFYSLITEALRRYIARASPDWGEDLTTAELLPRMAEVDPAPDELRRILTAADMVKFAGRTPGPDEARTLHAAARDWVERFDGRLMELTASEPAAGTADTVDEVPAREDAAV